MLVPVWRVWLQKRGFLIAHACETESRLDEDASWPGVDSHQRHRTLTCSSLLLDLGPSLCCRSPRVPRLAWARLEHGHAHSFTARFTCANDNKSESFPRRHFGNSLNLFNTRFQHAQCHHTCTHGRIRRQRPRETNLCACSRYPSNGRRLRHGRRGRHCGQIAYLASTPSPRERSKS